MTGTLLLALTLAQAAQPAERTASVQVGVLVTFADGATQLVSTAPRTRGVSYMTSNASCADAQVSSDPPANKAFGWEVQLAPTAQDTHIMWKRLEEASETRGPKNGVRTLPTAADGDWTALDHLDIRASAGCKVLHWSLVARRTPVNASRSKLMDAEFWFVHKAPDGKETSQRQSVRMRNGGRGDFYFDDTPLTLTFGDMKVPIAVEVFGTISTGTMMSGGDINMTLSLTRRYVNKETALGNWPKTGSTDYPMTVKAGEVVSFLLPPLKDDDGILLGHRFSLRLRLTPVGPGDN